MFEKDEEKLSYFLQTANMKHKFFLLRHKTSGFVHLHGLLIVVERNFCVQSIISPFDQNMMTEFVAANRSLKLLNIILHTGILNDRI